MSWLLRMYLFIVDANNIQITQCDKNNFLQCNVFNAKKIEANLLWVIYMQYSPTCRKWSVSGAGEDDECRHTCTARPLPWWSRKPKKNQMPSDAGFQSNSTCCRSNYENKGTWATPPRSHGWGTLYIGTTGHTCVETLWTPTPFREAWMEMKWN